MATTMAVFIVYLLLMLGIGFYFSKKANSLNSYYLGNRSMNKWVVAMSAQASDMSGWLLMGLPGAIYVSGLSEAWIGVGLAIGTYVNWKIVGRRLRKYTYFCNDSITLPDFFANRFRDRRGIIRVISALFILAFFLFYTTSGFVSCGKLFSTIFGWDYTVSLAVGVVVVVAYTFLGGFFAVSWTDFVQGILMLIAVLMIPATICALNDGFAPTVDAMNKVNPYLMNIFTNASTGKAITMISLVSSLAWGLGYFGMPHILVRFMSIKNPDEITHSRRIAMTWVVLSLGASILIAVFGRYYLMQQGIVLDDPEKVFMVLTRNLFPTVIAAVMMAAVLAAIMSTADSQLLVSASAFSNDLYKRLIHRNASNRELMLVSRGIVLAIALVAGFLAYQGRPNASHGFLDVVMSLVSFAWAGFGATFGPVVLLSLFWKRTNLAGAISGMLAGGILAFVWKFYLSGFADSCAIFGLYELVPGFAVSFATIVVVSLCTQKPSDEIVREFEQVNSSRLSDLMLK